MGSYNLGDPLINGLITGITAFGLYFFKKHRDSKQLNFKLGEMLNVEILKIVRLFYYADLDRCTITPSYFLTIFPRGIYDGLVNSGNISNFDKNIQKKLYEFYRYERISDYDSMNNILHAIAHDVDQFIKKNKLRFGIF